MGRDNRRVGRGFEGLPPEAAAQLAVPNYFVPSLSIRQHVANEGEREVVAMQRHAKRTLGKGFRVVEPERLTIKLINQRVFIRRVREAGVHPTPGEVKQLALYLCDELFKIFSNAPPIMELPLGHVAVYGDNNQVLGLEMAGWKGPNGRYGSFEASNGRPPTPNATIAAASQVCVNGIAEVMSGLSGQAFNTEGIARTPGINIAHKMSGIRDRELRKIDPALSDGLPLYVQMGDPIIDMRLERSQSEPTPLFIRRAYATLAVKD